MWGKAVIYLASVSTLLGTGCAPNFNKTLPASASLGNPRGLMIARTIIHLHSPYSYDTCAVSPYSPGTTSDGTGVANAQCLAELRTAVCKNRVDYVLMTDHPANMASYDFTHLLLNQTGDTLVSGGTLPGPIANQITCGDGHVVNMTVGFEMGTASGLMATMMEQHFDNGNADPTNRIAQYSVTGPTASLASSLTVLQNPATLNAVVFMPHSESRVLSDLKTLPLNGMEIYNLHANLDPTIRHTSLGLDYFSGIPDLLVYWLDPYSSQEPDLAFISFMQVAPVYLNYWNSVMAVTHKMMGIAGTDSHENILPYMARDGERLDAHRRILRWFSNHVLVPDMSFASMKTALQNERGWVVFEGLGSPVGMDFYATIAGTNYGPGDTHAFVLGGTVIHVPLPTLHPDSPTDGNRPSIITRLKHVNSGGVAVTDAEVVDGALNFAATAPGDYRAEISMVPNHLTGFLGVSRKLILKEMTWIITNHIHLN